LRNSVEAAGYIINSIRLRKLDLIFNTQI